VQLVHAVEVDEQLKQGGEHDEQDGPSMYIPEGHEATQVELSK